MSNYRDYVGTIIFEYDGSTRSRKLYARNRNEALKQIRDFAKVEYLDYELIDVKYRARLLTDDKWIGGAE